MSSVASAVEEQNAATADLTHTVQVVVDRTRTVIEGLNILPPVAAETDRLATGLATSASELAGEADRLHAEVASLVREIADRRAEPRLAAAGTVWLDLNGRRVAVEMVDANSAGIRVGTGLNLAVGQDLSFDPGEGTSLAGRVAWVAGGEMGIDLAPRRMTQTSSSRLLRSVSSAALGKPLAPCSDAGINDARI